MQGYSRKPHHDLRPAHQRNRVVGIEPGAGYEFRDDTNIAVPGWISMIDGNFDIHVQSPPPAFHLRAVKDVTWTARTIKQYDTSVPLALREHLVDGRPQGREAKSAGHNNDIVAFGDRTWPGGAKRTTHAHHVTGCKSGDRTGHCTDIAHRVHVFRLIGWIAAHADRRLANAERV